MSNTTPVSHRPIGRLDIDQGNKRDDDQLANSSLPYYKHGGIVLLEEKIVFMSDRLAGHAGGLHPQSGGI